MSLWTIAALSHPGGMREVHEDRYRVEPGPAFAIVADGMGGHAAGEIAAGIACEVVGDAVQSSLGAPGVAACASVPAALLRSFSAAHHAILSSAIQEPSRRGMGSAAVAFAADTSRTDGVVVAHVGDCRAYVLRRSAVAGEPAVAPRYSPPVFLRTGQSLACVTRDHASICEVVERGHLGRDAGRAHPLRSRLSRSLGIANPEPDIVSLAVADGDRLILCSDGLWEMVDDPEIAAISASAPTADAACEQLVQAALRRGGKDNVTVVVAERGAAL